MQFEVTGPVSLRLRQDPKGARRFERQHYVRKGGV